MNDTWNLTCDPTSQKLSPKEEDTCNKERCVTLVGLDTHICPMFPRSRFWLIDCCCFVIVLLMMMMTTYINILRTISSEHPSSVSCCCCCCCCLYFVDDVVVVADDNVVLEMLLTVLGYRRYFHTWTWMYRIGWHIGTNLRLSGSLCCCSYYSNRSMLLLLLMLLLNIII